jgi:hypothetical protein
MSRASFVDPFWTRIQMFIERQNRSSATLRRFKKAKSGIHLDMKMITVAWMWTKSRQRSPGLKTGEEKAPMLEEKHDNKQS